MARTLYLFSGLTPNIKQQPYYNIKVFSNYLNYLTTNFICEKVIADDNYRINGNILKVVLNGYVSNRPITYAVEVDTENAETYHRCYFVDAITNQSNMLYLTLSVDLWGTYYNASRIDHALITRCNRNIGIGIYDEIQHVETIENEDKDDHLLFFDGEIIQDYDPRKIYKYCGRFALVIVLNYNVRQGGITGEKISETRVMFSNLMNFDYGQSSATGILEGALLFLNGLQGVLGTGGQLTDAEISHAYIVPLYFIQPDGTGITLQSKFVDGNNHSVTSQKAFTFLCSFVPSDKDFEIKTADYDINYDYIAGCRRCAGLKLKRYTTNKLKFIYTCATRQDKLIVTVKQGEDEHDITQNFEVEITGASQNTTAIRQISNVLQTFGNALGASFAGLKRMGTGGAILGAVTSLTGALSSNEGVLNSLQGNGDVLGVLDYYHNSYLGWNESDREYVLTPFAVNLYKSTRNEKLHARYNGASFNEYIENINTVFDFDLLGEGDYELTFIQVSEIKINGLPTYARTEIENAFIRGVELLDYES